MAFIWNPNPTAPQREFPVPVANGKISYEQGEVANNVLIDPFYGAGQLSWNSTFQDYDIIYQLPAFNVHTLIGQNLTATNVIVSGIVTINTANISTATINTANISNATFSNGFMGVDPTSNLQIATKFYVDSLAANSTPLGGNLQLLIQAAGDLLVGVSDNTAERLPVGTTEGGALTVGGAGNTELFWSTGARGSLSTHRGLYIGTSLSHVLSNSTVTLVSVDEIVMNDGVRTTTGWAGKTANILSNVATTGVVGYLDTGVVRAQTCYEIWGVRDSISGNTGLVLHRAIECFEDVNIRPVTEITNSRKLNYALGSGLLTTINVGQSFIATNTGPFDSIEFQMFKTGNPVGNCWITIEDNIAGNASGIPLATSRKINAARIPTNTSPASRIRFVFDTRANVIYGNTYWGVCHADYPQGSPANENHLSLMGVSSTFDRYANGTAKQFSANTNTWVSANNSSPTVSDFYMRTFVESFNTDLLMPAGYDQKCLLSYAMTSGESVLCDYHQRGRKMSMNFHIYWNVNYNGVFGGGTPVKFSTGGQECLDLRHYVPPVPCLVMFTVGHYAAGTQVCGVGPVDCTNIANVTLSLPATIEAEGSMIANTMSTTLTELGPVFTDHGVVAVHTGYINDMFYISSVEY